MERDSSLPALPAAARPVVQNDATPEPAVHTSENRPKFKVRTSTDLERDFTTDPPPLIVPIPSPVPVRREAPAKHTAFPQTVANDSGSAATGPTTAATQPAPVVRPEQPAPTAVTPGIHSAEILTTHSRVGVGSELPGGKSAAAPPSDIRVSPTTSSRPAALRPAPPAASVRPALPDNSPPRPATLPAPVAPPEVTITIGRVEIRAAVPASPSPVPAPAPPGPHLSLDAYLRRSASRPA